MPRPVTTTRMLSIALTTIALGLSACGADDDPPSADVTSAVTDSGAATSTDAPEATSSNTDAPDGDSTGAEPTGQLTIDGQTWDLTYDADDLNALCQKLPGNSVVVSGMRTPEGNRVNITVQDVPRDNAMATYFGDDEVPLWAAATDGSSAPPEWSVDGTTVQLRGKWFNRLDPSLGEVDGELIVTC